MNRHTKASSSSLLTIYESRPPEWLPEIHRSGDLGYYGFHPPRPGQDEDVLTKATAMSGYVAPQSVNVETASAHALVNEELNSNPEVLNRLEELMNDVFARRAQRLPPVPTSTFRLPTRVTLNDAKRQAWFADLANPSVPLYKLGKSVPHGAKGHDLLDLLHKHNVAIDRAVWFLRVFGANETAPLRNKPSYNPILYSIEWANVINSYMKKQLAEIALPSAPRPGLNIKQSFKGVLTDTEARERWVSRFSYCLQLLRRFYAEGLVDARVFLTWLVQQIATCNLAQATFLLRLADEYLEGIMHYQALLRPFVDACLAKLAEIRSTGAQEHLGDTANLMKVILQRICLVAPDGFISPRVWTEHSVLLLEIFSEDVSQYGVAGVARELQEILISNASSIKVRNEAMLFRNLQPLGLQRLGSAVSDIRLLNSISCTTDMDEIAFFSNSYDDAEAFSIRLDMLLTWSTSPLQYGDHRPFAAVTLLQKWRLKTGDRATRRDITPPDEFIQDQLFNWLDTSPVAGKPENLRAVAILFGKLVKNELFSYARYIQRLIARGENGLAVSEPDTGSRHRQFLRWIPLHHSTPALISQRKVTLHGARVRETPEDICERELRKELRSALPDIFAGVNAFQPAQSLTAILAQCSAILSAPRYEQVRTFRDWLVPTMKKRLDQVSLQSFFICAEIMARVTCFDSLKMMCLAVLEHTTSSELLTAVIDTLQRHRTIWASMDCMESITRALYTAHTVWKKKMITNRSLLALLVELDAGRFLDPTERQTLSLDISTYALALQPQPDAAAKIPERLPEILLLANGDSADGPSMLAGQMWYKYRTVDHWAMTVWDNTVASIRQIPHIHPDMAARRSCALRYAIFLTHVDQHLPAGLDDQVLQWFLSTGQTEIATLSEEAWKWLSLVLVYLSIQGSLKTTTTLRGLVYPVWEKGSLATIDATSCGVMAHAVSQLFTDLMLREDGTLSEMPPCNFLDIERIFVRRDEVYHEPYCTMLVQQIPVLVRLEGNWHLPDAVREEVGHLRKTLCSDPDFRGACHRNLDTLRLVFEQCLQSEGINDNMEETLITSLELALSPESRGNVQLSSQWKDVSALLSPWQLAATAIKLQFSLRRLGKGLSQESTRADASASIDELAHMIFHYNLSQEEAFFVAEMARGADHAVINKLINNGLKRIASILSSHGGEDYLQCAGNLLRVLTHVAEPLRAESTQGEQPAPLLLDAEVQTALMPALCKRLTALKSQIDAVSGEKRDDLCTRLQDEIVFLSRLLHFDLGFSGVWPTNIRDMCQTLSETLFRLTLIYSTGSRSDLVTFPLLFDTLLFTLDEMPVDSRVTAAFEPFRYYPQSPSSEIPSNTSEYYRKKLESLLPWPIPNEATTDLATARKGEGGSLQPGAYLINHPWEWMENLGEPAGVEDPKVTEEKHRLHARYIVKNSASLSLESFGVEVTGDGALVHDVAPPNNQRVEGHLRTFEDSLTSETMYQRDWRQMRVDITHELTSNSRSHHLIRGVESDNEDAHSIYGSSHGTADKRSTPRGSPSSVVSRSSAHQQMSGSSRRPSPAQTLQSSMSVDRESATSGSGLLPATRGQMHPTTASKRKADPIPSDDEIEILDGPPPRDTKKAKTKQAPKPKMRKR